GGEADVPQIRTKPATRSEERGDGEGGRGHAIDEPLLSIIVGREDFDFDRHAGRTLFEPEALRPPASNDVPAEMGVVFRSERKGRLDRPPFVGPLIDAEMG